MAQDVKTLNQKGRERRRKLSKTNPELLKSRDRQYGLYAKYRISPEEYDSILKRQNGVCAICFKSETIKGPTGEIRPLSVDHSHRTGKVRGLLCTNCNVILGKSHEDPEVLISVIKYLRKGE